MQAALPLDVQVEMLQLLPRLSGLRHAGSTFIAAALITRARRASHAMAL